jgi:hypothetical protein
MRAEEGVAGAGPATLGDERLEGAPDLDGQEVVANALASDLGPLEADVDSRTHPGEADPCSARGDRAGERVVPALLRDGPDWRAGPAPAV